MTWGGRGGYQWPPDCFTVGAGISGDERHDERIRVSVGTCNAKSGPPVSTLRSGVSSRAEEWLYDPWELCSTITSRPSVEGVCHSDLEWGISKIV